jgi:hypothetical protein
MATYRSVLLAGVCLVALVSTGGRSRTSARSLPEGRPRLIAGYGQLPLSFEANHGQADEPVRFLARGRGYGLFLTPTESVLALHRSKEASAPPVVVRMKLLRANPRAAVKGRELLPGKSNHFIGNDPSKWQTDVPQYARVEYEDVYPGVSLTYYGNQGQLEYDFVVAPGADPKQIHFAIAGADALRIDKDGNLVLSLPDGEVVHRAPVVYQEVNGARGAVEGRFALKGEHEVGFEVDQYDPERPLVVDPVLAYSTYLGGSADDWGWSIAVDASGNTYVAGSTSSIDFPTAAPMQPANAGQSDAFVVKVSASGALVYSTYLGGIAHDSANGIAVDASGSGWIAGQTSSTDFPTANPVQAANGGGDSDAFVAKLNATGSALVYSTYLGGSGGDDGRGIAVDPSGNGYITGLTTSNNFPTANPLQPTSAGSWEAFVAKLNAAGSALVYSTYLGGNGPDIPYGIAADPSGNAYVTGQTSSTNFPTANAFQNLMAGGSDAFVTKLDVTGSALIYSTYLGGSLGEAGGRVAADSSGNAYVLGQTVSTDFPTVNPVQAMNRGDEDTFVAKLNAAGSALVFSTYLGGSFWDVGMGIAVDAAGSAHITGFTQSADFPLVRSFQPFSGGSFKAFVSKLSAAGSTLVYSTYLGGSASLDYGHGIAADSSGMAHVVGITSATDFPTRHPIQETHAGGIFDVFVAKIGSASPPAGDFDFDGKPDVLWRDQGDTGLITVWFMNGANRTGATLTTPEALPVLSWQIAGTADFNGDDKTDILWRDQGDTGQIVVWLMLGTAQTSSTPTDPSAVPNLNWRIVGLGDFNGDGKTDILWRDQGSTGQIAVWFMDGTTRTGATLTSPGAVPLLDWEIVGTGDFNRDAKTDILWRDTRSSGQIGVWFMDGTVRTGATLLTPSTFPLNAQIQAVSDYNGDGKPDIVWRDQVGTGLIGIWFMDGTTRTSATLTDPPAVPNLNWKIVGPR